MFFSRKKLILGKTQYVTPPEFLIVIISFPINISLLAELSKALSQIHRLKKFAACQF